MFKGCNSLKNLELYKIDSQNIRYMNNLFTGCNSLIRKSIFIN